MTFPLNPSACFPHHICAHCWWRCKKKCMNSSSTCLCGKNMEIAPGGGLVSRPTKVSEMLCGLQHLPLQQTSGICNASNFFSFTCGAFQSCVVIFCKMTHFSILLQLIFPNFALCLVGMGAVAVAVALHLLSVQVILRKVDGPMPAFAPLRLAWDHQTFSNQLQH